MSLPLRKSALAASYFPELASHQACNRLRRWIIRCTELYDKLRETGYRPAPPAREETPGGVEKPKPPGNQIGTSAPLLKPPPCQRAENGGGGTSFPSGATAIIAGV